MKPNWNKQETGRPVHCEKAEGLMHVSMSYNDLRLNPAKRGEISTTETGEPSKDRGI